MLHFYYFRTSFYHFRGSTDWKGKKMHKKIGHVDIYLEHGLCFSFSIGKGFKRTKKLQKYCKIVTQVWPKLHASTQILLINYGDKFWNMLKVLWRSNFIWLRYFDVSHLLQILTNRQTNKQTNRHSSNLLDYPK